ncbi:MAG: MFS transporter [Verrucomicrobiota bacterium]
MVADTPAVKILKFALDNARLGRAHWWLWGIAAICTLVDGYSMFITAVAMPLLQKQFNMTAAQQGSVGAFLVIGAMVGATLGGRLSDRFGRRRMFIVILIAFLIGFSMQAFANSLNAYLFWQIELGAAIGVGYPVCATYISESMPTAYRGRMLIGLFAFQAVGSVLASISAANCVRVVESVEAWRWMVGLGAVPAAIGLLLCARLPESARWLLARDRILEAAEGIRHLIAPATLPDLPPSVPSTSQSPAENLSMLQVLKEMASPKMRRDSILAVVPWFLCDALHFSIVMFAPFILEKLLQADGLPFLEGCIRAAQANLLLSGALLIGFGLNCWMIDRVGRMKLQAFGFLGMAASLAVLGQFAAMAQAHPGNTSPVRLMLVAFIAFNLCLNIGPNATTFMLPAELFPTRLRASAHGIATSIGRLGAASCVLTVPLLQSAFGNAAMLWCIAPLAAVASFVTFLCWHETKGTNLEDVGN